MKSEYKRLNSLKRLGWFCRHKKWNTNSFSLHVFLILSSGCYSSFLHKLCPFGLIFFYKWEPSSFSFAEMSNNIIKTNPHYRETWWRGTFSCNVAEKIVNLTGLALCSAAPVYLQSQWGTATSKGEAGELLASKYCSPPSLSTFLQFSPKRQLWPFSAPLLSW